MPDDTTTTGTNAAGAKHCPFRRTTDLLQRLAPARMRVGFFLGAGCPLSVRVEDGHGRTKPLIPEIAGLTNAVKSSLDGNERLATIAAEAWGRVTALGTATPTVEHILSHVRALISLCPCEGTIDGFRKDELVALDREICQQVRELVSPTMVGTDTPYHRLASWIQAVPRDKPVEIFTTNYDLLLEQALEEIGVPYFDGFVGSDTAFLDLESMAEDDLPPRWARLWKIHGSINWWLTASNGIRRSRQPSGEEQSLIYPSHLKYSESRQMPYYAMLDRLRAFLRGDQCVLVTCGYSFGDEHINAHIAQGLAANPNASCLAMLFQDRSTAPQALRLARHHANLTVLAADGAVVGTMDADWHSDLKEDNPAYRTTVSKEVAAGRSASPADRCKWLLGDFDSLGRFLGYQLSTNDVIGGFADGS